MASSVAGALVPQDHVSQQTGASVRRPRVAIQFCTQCKWMLRAAYYAQELLSTFGPALGEVALQPATGGVFTVTIEAAGDATAATPAPPKLLWDRKTDGGFPETKELKRRVRDVIEPGRDLGHVDRAHSSTTKAVPAHPVAVTSESEHAGGDGNSKTVLVCEDCQ